MEAASIAKNKSGCAMAVQPGGSLERLRAFHLRMAMHPRLPEATPGTREEAAERSAAGAAPAAAAKKP